MLLAIDTATRLLGIALHSGDALIAECTLQAGRKHSAMLAPLVENLLMHAGLSTGELTALAVSVGPGSYTGLRIGVALAKGMASVRDLPLVPVTTLEAIAAAQASRDSDMPLIATVPAGRNRAIWGEYQQDGATWSERRAPRISDWTELLSACPSPCRISGEITEAGLSAIRCAQSAGASIEIPSAAERLRRAGILAEIALARLRQNQADRPFPAERVMPLYLKSPG